MRIRSRKCSRGQTVLETTFVFWMILLMTFGLINYAVLLHTKTVATYAAFMAARSFQVLGDGTAAQSFLENTDFDSDGKNQELMRELEGAKYPAFFRVAEDIFTCALPWMSVPDGDESESIGGNDDEKTIDQRCMAGKRKYETLNIGEPSFAPFDPSDENMDVTAANATKGFMSVRGGFAEEGREPLRYGVLRLAFRNPIFADPFGFFGNGFAQGNVYVPVLLNPGLRIQLEEGSQDDEETFKNSNYNEDKIRQATEDAQRAGEEAIKDVQKAPIPREPQPRGRNPSVPDL